MESSEVLRDVVLEEDPEQDQNESLVPAGRRDAPDVGRARARVHTRPTRKGKRRAVVRPHRVHYPFDVRLRLVKMHVEEGIGVKQIAAEAGISVATLFNWFRSYRVHGEAGLRPGDGRRAGRKQIPDAVKAEMVATKRSQPTWGVTRISQFLKRMLHLPGSPETVRRTLHTEALIESKPPRPAKMPTKPRFF